MPALSKFGTRAKTAKPFQRGYVGKGSKSKDPACSEAMSVWVRSRNAGQAVSAAIFALLGKCRSMARQKTQAGRLANAGQDLKAQALRARLDKQGVTGFITAKDRTARARQLVAERATRQAATANTQAAAPVPARKLAPGRGTPERATRAQRVARARKAFQARAASEGMSPTRYSTRTSKAFAGVQATQAKVAAHDTARFKVEREAEKAVHADAIMAHVKAGNNLPVASMMKPRTYHHQAVRRVGNDIQVLEGKRWATIGPNELAATAARVAKPAAPNLPPRTADTMSEAIAMSSPSGKMSGRAQAAANERLRTQLFGKEGLPAPTAKQPTAAQAKRQQAKELRDLAERGMKPRAYRKKADQLEAQAAALEKSPARAAAMEKQAAAGNSPKVREVLGYFDATGQNLRGGDVIRQSLKTATPQDLAALRAHIDAQGPETRGRWNRWLGGELAAEQRARAAPAGPAAPKPTEHATIGHKPGESFSLATRAASRSSKGPENLGRGRTPFMFDMNKRDLKGQTSMFDKPEAPKPARPPKTARERYNQASRILLRIPKHRLELATRTGTPSSKLYGKNEQVGAREGQLKAARERAATTMNRSLGAIAREKAAASKLEAKPAGPSLKEQAAAKRASKGTIAERLIRIRGKASVRNSELMARMQSRNADMGKLRQQSAANRAREQRAIDIYKAAAKGKVVSRQTSKMAAAVKAVSQLRKTPGKLGEPAAAKPAKAQKAKKLTRSDYKIMAGSALRQHGHATRAGDLIGAQRWLEHHKILKAAAKGKSYTKQGGWNMAPASEQSAAAAIVARVRAGVKPQPAAVSSTRRPAPGPTNRGGTAGVKTTEKAFQAPRRLSPREVLAKQRSTTAAKVKTYRAEHLEQAEPHKYGKPGKAYQMGTDKIHFDPKRFQYKLAAQGNHGVTDALSDVQKFDHELAGSISVWRDPANGKTYVVNGHHRLDLANRLGEKTIHVKYLDAPTAEAARAKGALVNIAEGRGSALDAAKFFRDTKLTPEHVKAKGVSLKEHTARQGLAMSTLSDPIFHRVVDGQINHNRAAILGGGGLSHAQQDALVKVLDQPRFKNVTDGTIKNMVEDARAAGSTTKEVRDLFGTSQEEQALFVHRAQVADSIKRSLAEDERLFKAVSKSKAAQKLAERGGETSIDTDTTGHVATESEQFLKFFDQLRNRDPRISKPLNEAAERIANGENRKTVTAETHKHLARVVKDILSGKLGAFD